MIGIRNVLLAAAAGFTLNLAFPDTSWWFLAPVSVAVLWWALERATAWSGLALGWVYGTAFFLPHLAWADFAVGPIPWIALSVAQGLALGLTGMGWAHVRRSGMLESHRWAAAPVFALLWVATEQLRSLVPFGGFPWGRIGYAFADAPAARLAWVGGVPLVSFVVVLSGALLGAGFEALRRRHILTAALAPVLAIGLLAAGYAIPLDAQEQAGEVRLGIVQGNTPDRGLDSFDNAREVTNNHRDETLRMVEEHGTVDLLVWPENAADYDPRVDKKSMAVVLESAQAAQAPILLGTVDYSPEDGRYNTSLLLSTTGTVLDHYSKQRPAPFAEYIPLRGISRHFSPWVDRVVDMIPGTEPAVIEAPVEALGRTVRLGTVICFEVAYDAIVRDAVNDGAELLIVQTNNATFGRTAESTQQLQMTQLRAIETGRMAIQASTVGVSAVVDASGRIREQTELFEPTSMVVDAQLRTEVTPAMRIGGLLGWAFLLVPALIVAMAMRSRIAQRYDW